MQISVILATYNRERLLEGALEALGLQRVPGGLEWEIVVVDNASRDGTAELVRRFSKKAPVAVRCVLEPRQGVSHAKNRGVREARGGILAFTDDDVIPAPDWVAQIPAAIDRWKAHGVGGRILPRWEAPAPSWLTGSKRLRESLALMESEESLLLSLPRRLPTIWGANMALRREVFERAGGFDPRRGILGKRLFRGEEVDLVERALGIGFRLAYDPALVVFHRIGPDRMRRAYFRRLFFENALGSALVGSPARSRRRLLGAPLGLYRSAVTGLPRWMALSLLRRPEAFESQLTWLEAVGGLSGYWGSRLKGRRFRSDHHSEITEE